MSGLKKKLISGFGYMAIAKYSGFIINLLVTAILARILAPEVFGIVSIANIFIGIFSVISDFGIASAIVQNQTFDEKDYSNVFSITVYFSLILAAIFLLLLYPLNLVYKSKELINICYYLVIQIVFVTLNIVPNGLLLKAKSFRFIAIRTFLVQLLCGVAAILCAYNGLGAYSLVIAPIGSSVLIFIFNYIKHPLLFQIKPSLDSLKNIFSYSIYNFAYNITNYFSRSFDKFVLGKAFSFDILGYYEKSYSLMLLPVQNIIAIVNPVIHPILTKYQDNMEVLYSYFLRFVKLFAYCGFPLSAILFFTCEDIVHVILGNNWEPTIQIFKIFSISVCIQIITSIQGPFFLICNNTKDMFFAGLVTFFITLISIIVGICFKSVYLVAVLVSISYFTTGLYTFFVLVNHNFKRPLSDIIKCFVKPIFLSLFITLCLFLCTKFVPDYGCILNLIIKISVSCVSAVGYLYFFRDDNILDYIPLFSKKIK